MIFERAWVLPLLLLPILWVLWQWPRSGRRWGLLLKTLSVAAILLALSEPTLSVWETKMAVAVLSDTSASISAQDLDVASSFVAKAEEARGRHLLRIMPFANGVRPLQAAESENGWNLKTTEGTGGRSTDVEAAVLDSIAAMPAGLVPRIVLLSDGKQNRGSAERAAWRARNLGIPVDTVPLAGRPQPELQLDSVTFPATAFTGERFPIELSVRAPRRASGTVRVSAEGRDLGVSAVELEAGDNHLLVHATLNVDGAFDLSGVLEADGLGELRFAQAVAVRRPRVLYASQDPPGTEIHFTGALRSGQFDIVEARSIPADGLDEYQVVILNNWDLESVADERKEALEQYVRQGGGLLVIGGERNVYVDDPRKREDALERVLPAKLVPPRSPEGTVVVLIVDKSSSMEGRKMELARLSAIGVVENLRPVDRVGVLIFDNSFQWAVPIRKAENRTLIKRLISGITPDGGTQIAPALSEAYRRILPIKATFKHIVLLTDGISEEGDSIALAQEAANHKVTISTVGLGQDVNRAYLERVALFAKGKSYVLTDPSSLAQILLRDVMEHTGETTVEKPVRPVVVQEAEIFADLDPDELPVLKGYVRYESRATAETLLNLDTEDPLLARWQYGLGKATVFTSDAKSRWAEAWVDWDGYDTFWTNIVRDLLPHATFSDASITHDRANGELVVDYHLASQAAEPEEIPDIFVVGPGSFRTPLAVSKVAAGAYRGTVAVGDRQGLFRVRTLSGSRIFPEIGIYLQEAELSEYGQDEALLKSMASFTGGEFNPDPSTIFDSGGRAVPSTMPLWPGFLMLALALSIAELIHRKWGAIRGR